MCTPRVKSARELALAAGRLPAALAALALSSAALAQPAGEGPVTTPTATTPAATPAQPRDPMKPGRDAGDQPQVKVSEHNTVDLHVKDEELANVLELLSIQTQKNIVASKNVGGKITATLYGVTFYQALDSILHVNGFGYIEDGNFIYVYTNDELKAIEAALKKRVAKVIRLNYLNATDAADFVKDLLSKDGGQIKTNQAAKVGTEKPAFTNEDYALTSTLVVIDYEENIEAIERLIKELDTKPAQVLVEATILQAALNEANAWGVDFSIIGDVDFTDFLNVGGPLGVANALQKGGAGTSGGFSPPDNKGGGLVSSPGNTAGPSTIKLGIISDDISVFLRALDQVTDTSILSNPKILALNRQPARVLVGRRVGYLSTTSSETSTTQTVEFLDTGTQLYFRPFVSDSGEIRLELKPQVSEAEIRDVTDATGAVVTIPDEITQELTTNVNVRDGQTIVLGGLFRESTSFTRRQVPFLGDLPIVGAAFRGNDDATLRSEIIFLITPSIVSDSMLADAADRAEGDIVRIRAGSRQGLLPWSRERMTSALNVDAEKLAREGKHQEALYKIQRSLALNPLQPDAFRLREQILGESEVWPDRSVLNEVISGEAAQRAKEINPSAEPLKYRKPDKHRNVPRQPIDGRAPAAVGANTPATPETNPGSETANASTTTNAAAFSNPNPATPAATTPNTPANPTTTPPTPTNVSAATPGDETKAVESVKRILPAVRGQIELFSVMNSGARPELGVGGSGGWEALVDEQMIRTAPANAWVGGPNSTKVVVSTTPDTTFHTNYGWIFDPATGKLWAAGFDGNDNPLPRTDAFTAASTPTTTGPADPTWGVWMEGLVPAEMLQTLREMSAPTTSPAVTGVESEDGE